MLAGYNRLCAYLALYIHNATGSPSVDHVIPKSRSWDKVYEWSNYRLACSLINSTKNNVGLVLDPFTISEGLFALEFVEFQVKPGPSAGSRVAEVTDTIDKLGLNLPECRDARRAYFECYVSGDITRAYLERRAPFIALEMQRQGLLR